MSIEQHSAASLSARLGIARASAMGALASGKIKVLQTFRFGSRTSYMVSTASIEAYKANLLRKLEAKAQRISSDPAKVERITANAIRALQAEVEAEAAEVVTPAQLAERLAISLELAGWLLERHAERVQNGFRLTPEILAAIRDNLDKLNRTGPRRNSI